MNELIRSIFGAFSDLKRYIFVKGLFVGFVFSAIVTVVVAVFSGIIAIDPNGKGVTIDSHDWKSTFIATGFPVLWLLVTFVSYLALVKERDDIYSWLRKKLAGNWAFQVESWRLGEDGEWKKEFKTISVLMTIDQKSQKLKAKFFQLNHEFFLDEEFDTGVVSIEDMGATYSLDVLVRCDQRLKPEYKNIVSQETFKMVMLGTLTIRDFNDKKVYHMKGQWYDVNNTLWSVVSRLRSDESIDKLWHSFGEDINTFQGELLADRVDS